MKSSAVELTIENREFSEMAELGQGEDADFTPFKSVLVSHGSGVPQTVKLTFSSGGKRSRSAQVAGSIAVTNLPSVNGAFGQARASVTNANQLLKAANPSRRYLLIQNNDPAAVLRITLDGNPATAVQGLRLQPGESFELPPYASTGDVNGIMETASAVSGNVEVVYG